MATQDPNLPGPTPDDPNRKRDPAYEGAKPATFPLGVPPASFFGAVGRGGGSDAMSAQLAQNWWAVLLRGIFAILFGIVALLLPGVTLAALVLLFAAYMLVDGVFAIIAGVRAARQNERWGLLVLEGIIDLVAGAVAFVWPIVTVLVFILLMGAWAVVSGVLMLAAAFRLHVAHGRWLMGFGAVASIVWGVLLLLWPLVGAIVVTWWIGAYALFFGGALIALGLRLRHMHRRPPAPRPAMQGA